MTALCEWHGCHVELSSEWLEWYPYCAEHMARRERMNGRTFEAFVTPKLVLDVSKVTARRRKQRQAATEKRAARRMANARELASRTSSRLADYETARDDGELAAKWKVKRSAVRDWRRAHDLPAKKPQGGDTHS